MITKILLIFLIKVLARILGGKFHEEFSLSKSLSSLYDEDIEAIGSGFVFGRGDKNFGVYIVTYENILYKNLNGRWN